jgi:hypothetical protein
MPLFVDVHTRVDGLTAEGVDGAHSRGREAQGAYGEGYLKHWFDDGSGPVHCLVDALSEEAANAVHREVHRLVADELAEVAEGH